MGNPMLNKLMSLGVPIMQAKRLIALGNPETSKAILCGDCFNKMYEAAASGQNNPTALMSQICEYCKHRLTEYLEAP